MTKLDITGHLYDGTHGPTIILELWDPSEAMWLARIFRSIRDGYEIDLIAKAEIRVTDVHHLILAHVEERPWKHLVANGPGSYVWGCTSDEWETAAWLLEPFSNGRTGHQYLTAEHVDDALIEVSFGEK